MSKKLSVVFNIDNDLSEHYLRTKLEGIGASHFNTLPNTDHLKENETFKKLIKAKKEAQLNLDRFINANRL